MTGTGTQADPFIVDNWSDFSTISTDNSKIYVRWADTGNKVIDFNDIKPEGFSTTVNFPANVDFNGWILRNFHSTAGSAITIGVTSATGVQNLIFENFYIISTNLFNGNFILQNCIISGIIQSKTGVDVMSTCTVKQCSMNLKITTNSVFYLSGGSGSSSAKIQNSDIILDVLCGSPVKLSVREITNCRITGKIQTTATEVSLENSCMSNVYSIESNAPLLYKGSFISVYNSDLAKAGTSSSTYLKPCTSEQLKNAEYLYKIGFPIGVD